MPVERLGSAEGLEGDAAIERGVIGKSVSDIRDGSPTSAGACSSSDSLHGHK